MTGEGEALVVECFVLHPITEGSNGDKERPKGQVAEYFNFEYFNSANKNYGSILLLRKSYRRVGLCIVNNLAISALLLRQLPQNQWSLNPRQFGSTFGSILYFKLQT